MPKKVYRAAIYCRLSREDGDKVESNSIASQKAICEDFIARHEDIELVCEPFIDDGYSGVSFNRPRFKQLEDAIRKGTIDCIVVKDLSRFSRNYIDAGRYLEKLFPQLGVRFIAVNDAYDSLTGDPQSDSFVIPFKNLINDSYCKDISMKIRSSLEVKQKNGEFVGAFAPYGYMKSPENKNQLIVDEAVSEYVQMIFSIPVRRVSHSAVSCGDVRLSGRIATRLYPSFVGISFLPLRSAKPALMSFSMIPARVAVVPNPLRSASSGVSSFPALSIAESNVSSVNAFGGCV